jgi:serine/threonine-protein kinase RsbW
MSVGIRLQIDSDLDKVALVARAVRALCSDVLDEEASDAVEISLVEAINNVIKHGYAGQPGRDVGVLVTMRQGEVEIEVVDQAVPMEAGLLASASEDRFAFDITNLDAIPEGGMGLALIRMNMDEVEYRSGNGENRLRMVKRLPPRAVGAQS